VLVLRPEVDGTVPLDRLRRWWCALRGHDTLLHYQDEKLSLWCASCDHETPGWALNETPPTVTQQGDPRRHALNRPRLVAPRRIA
jgi:hypothetical protein